MNHESSLLLRKLLTYGGCGKNAEELGAVLENRFPDLFAVFTSDVGELKKLGLSQNCSIFLHMILPTVRESMLRKKLKADEVYDTAEKLGMLFHTALGYYPVEVSMACLLDRSFHVLDLVKVSRGSVNEAPLLTRNLAEIAIRGKASYIAIAHNHPGGVAEPSEVDRMLTKEVQFCFEQLDIPLLEHFVVTDSESRPFTPMMLGHPLLHPCKNVNVQKFYTLHMRQEAGLDY